MEKTQCSRCTMPKNCSAANQKCIRKLEEVINYATIWSKSIKKNVFGVL